MKKNTWPFEESTEKKEAFRGRIADYLTGNRKFCLLDSGSSPLNYDLLCGWGVNDEFSTGYEIEDLSGLDLFLRKHQGKWIFGHVCYELKDYFEKKLNSSHPHNVPFPLLTFFVADYVLGIRNHEIFIVIQNENTTATPESIYQEIMNHPVGAYRAPALQDGSFHQPATAEYQASAAKIIGHLEQGDIYELNYCLPFRLSGILPSPAATWNRMQQQQSAGFSAFYRNEDNWLLCCSPERFLRKTGTRISSHPIKGTSKRSRDPEEDNWLKNRLFESEKERAENVMIVDLVRNDLGKIARTGSVQVDELFGIYSFPQVHQMISTISAETKPGIRFSEILQATFPMGSMTGAPKFRAMQLIEEMESFRRGLYSGTVGYISPEGDFDLNVVIRSILYNEQHQQILFPAGSAVTALSDPGNEYEECLLKAQGMLRILITDLAGL